MGASLEIAKHDRGTIFLRQPSDLVFDERFAIAPFRARVPDRGGLDSVPFDPTAASGFDRSPRCNPRGDSVQPTGNGASIANPIGISQQDKECCLKRVLGIVGIVQHSLANPQHHWSMPLEEQLEGRLEGLDIGGHDPVDQLPVGKPSRHSDAP